MSNYIVIPARLESTRLPRKLMLDETGQPLILHTVQNAMQSKLAAKIFVATDSNEIADVINDLNYDKVTVIITGHCDTGTERVSVACEHLDEIDIVVNWQGDEPDINFNYVDDLFRELDGNIDHSVITLASPATQEEMISPSVVKVVTDNIGNAMYFSRCPIPYGSHNARISGNLKHIGVYAYRVGFLQSIVCMPESTYVSERLEQLQWLENQHSIKVLIKHINAVGIDTIEEYQKFVSSWFNKSCK
jgi:3-deoxy-manno-octulosonate cytidylyltransferase (CMP-KDO synthetase)